MRYEYFQGNNGQWYVRLVGKNGETMMTSEGYTRRWNAKRAAVRMAGPMRVEVKEASA